MVAPLALDDTLYADDSVLERELRRYFGEHALLKAGQAFMHDAHDGERRYDGLPVIDGHLIPVTIGFLRYAAQHDRSLLTPVNAVAAMNHDSLEDNEGSKEINGDTMVRRLGSRVYGVVLPLTKPRYQLFPGATRWEQKEALNASYIPQLLKAPRAAHAIKGADKDQHLQTIDDHPLSDRREYLFHEMRVHYQPLFEAVLPYYARTFERRLRSNAA